MNNRFVLEEELGRGGMGIVYKARDLRKEEARDRDMYVAIKVLNAEFNKIPEAFIDLQRECKKAQRLAHPNIITVYDFDRDHDTFYMTMEILEGESLEHLLKRLQPDGLPYKTALPIIADMVQGLSYAHELGITHADFKPGNVFVLGQNGKAKILDFGIAKAIIRPDQNENDISVYVRSWEGLSPAYASCEMFDKAPADPRDDIYGLACVSYELLAGRHPFDKLPANQARQQKLKPEPIATLSRKQNLALARGLSFDRNQRTPSAKQFLDDLTDDGKSNNKKTLIWFIIFLTVLMLSGGGYYYFKHIKPPVVAPSIPIVTPEPITPPKAITPQQTPAPVTTPTPTPIVSPITTPTTTPAPLPTPAPTPEIPPEIQARIDDLLNIADLHLSERKLVAPDDNNA
ncbi:MAG: serine/threonine protein kinase, partial [Deltaproteobacteria bacterium]|nr:serine/threonine protein kinase [Candidatus Tharpella aukensis]